MPDGTPITGTSASRAAAASAPPVVTTTRGAPAAPACAGLELRSRLHVRAGTDHRALHAHRLANPGARPDDRLAHDRVRADDHTFVQHRALDRGVGPDRAVRPEHALRPDVRAARDRA